MDMITILKAERPTAGHISVLGKNVTVKGTDMTENLVPLEDWVAQVSSSFTGQEAELLRLFKRDWYEGHSMNPLLFPLNLDVEYWRDQFDWYVKVETFAVPGREREEAAPSQPEPRAARTEPLAASAATDEEKTIIIDSAGARDMMAELKVPKAAAAEAEAMRAGPCTETEETVIIDPGGQLGELDDLGTLITEAREAPARKNRAAPAETEQAEPQAEADETVIIEQTDPVGALDDQGTLIMDREPADVEGPAPAATSPEKKADEGEMILELDDLGDMDWIKD